MRKIILLIAVLCGCVMAKAEMNTLPQPADNQIVYRSADHQKITPNKTDVFGANIISNEYDTVADMGTITFSGNVTTIGDWAFAGCANLISPAWPSTMTSIGDGAFSGCSGLTSITIPNSVTEIGSHAFLSCKDLTSVTNLSSTPQSIGSRTFSTYGTLHVLPGCKEVYQNANYWSKFTIVEDAAYSPEMVVDLIDLINKVEYTDACKEKIEAARAAYDTLPEDQKALVKNYSVLTDAEEEYDKLEAATGITDINAETTIKDGKYLKNGRIVIIKNGRKYNSNGLLKCK